MPAPSHGIPLRKPPCPSFHGTAPADDSPFDENSCDAFAVIGRVEPLAINVADHQLTGERRTVRVLAKRERFRAHATGAPVTEHAVDIGGADLRRSTFDGEAERTTHGLAQ